MSVHHGTAYRYKQGCRCGECREAQRIARRKTRDRARAENRPSYQRELATGRAVKERYRGVCQGCGASTTGCDGPSSARQFCYRCSAAIVAKRRIGQGPMQRRALTFLTVERGRSDICDHLGISHGYASALVDRLMKHGLIRRTRRGHYIGTA